MSQTTTVTIQNKRISIFNIKTLLVESPLLPVRLQNEKKNRYDSHVQKASLSIFELCGYF